VHHFFGTRHGPEKLKSSEKVVVVAVTQVHGTEALVLDRPATEPEAFNGGWDALITNQPHVLLTIRTADCVPVLVLDPVHRVVAAIHAGWRGAVGGIVLKTLSLMGRRFGSDPRYLRVGIGPSAGPCCYEVDGPVLNRLREGFADWRSVVREAGSNKAMLDLRGLVRCQAEALGVSGEEVRKVSVCTICNPGLFYSYRREGAVKAAMVSGIMLTR
jgi:YfiH family protein